MKRKILSILFVATVFLAAMSFFAAPPQSVAADVPTAQPPATILFITGYGMGTKLLSNLSEDLVALGYTVINATTVNASILVGGPCWEGEKRVHRMRGGDRSATFSITPQKSGVRDLKPRERRGRAW